MIIPTYVFDASAKTVTIIGPALLELEGLKLITNLVDGVLIYQFNNVLKGGTLAGNVVTLTYDTTAMSDTDELMIIYDTPGEGELTILFDEVTTYTYVGYATPGTPTSSASWRIKRLTNASGNVEYAEGSADFVNIWNNRVSLSYS